LEPLPLFIKGFINTKTDGGYIEIYTKTRRDAQKLSLTVYIEGEADSSNPISGHVINANMELPISLTIPNYGPPVLKYC
jgi:hypothetical protein